MYISIIIIAIAVNYASEFRELFEATTNSFQSVRTRSSAQSASNLKRSQRCLPGGQNGRDVKLTNYLQVPEVKNNYIRTSTHIHPCAWHAEGPFYISLIFLWTVVSTVRCMTPSDFYYNEKRRVNTCKETVVAYFKALFRTSNAETNKTTKHLSGVTVEIRNKHLQNGG
jgi:hypothetical protein